MDRQLSWQGSNNQTAKGLGDTINLCILYPLYLKVVNFEYLYLFAVISHIWDIQHNSRSKDYFYVHQVYEADSKCIFSLLIVKWNIHIWLLLFVKAFKIQKGRSTQYVICLDVRYGRSYRPPPHSQFETGWQNLASLCVIELLFRVADLMRIPHKYNIYVTIPFTIRNINLPDLCWYFIDRQNKLFFIARKSCATP